MANKHYYRTECAIFHAFCKCRDCPSAKKIAKQAQVSRSTLHRHHRSVNLIIRDYEEYLFKTFSHIIKHYLRKKHPKLRVVYLRTLIFISNNRMLFKELFNENHKEIIKKMLNHISAIVIDEWRLGKNPEKMFIVYENEVLGAIEIWAKQNFSNQYLDQTLENIIHLTKMTRHNLLPLK